MRHAKALKRLGVYTYEVWCRISPFDLFQTDGGPHAAAARADALTCRSSIPRHLSM